MLRNFIFRAGYLLKRPGVIRWYNEFQNTQWQSLEWLQNQQEKQLRELIKFAYENVPYYTEVFKKHGIGPNDITSSEDLNKLPILTKQTIKQNWQYFIPRNIRSLKHVTGSTGGSTGVPLRYLMSAEDYEIGTALLYRGWGYAGYKLGDKIAVIAGSSLIPTTKSETKRKVQDLFLNEAHYSAYEMSPDNLYGYFKDIDRLKPLFIQGYASAIYVFAKFIRDNNLKLGFQPKAVLSTAEKLFDKQKTIIEEVLGAKVFDTYGLNDGGVSAYECEERCGMHIDMERAILEIVDEEGKNTSKEGGILATSLYNYAFPFIRYDTGDLGTISDSECGCGRKMLLLKEIVGRVTDFLNVNNTIIGSPVLTVLMGKFDIEQYQIVQENPDTITCKIIKGKTYKDKDEKFIKESFYKHVGEINIKFDYVNAIPVTEAGKHKFIIKETDQT